MSLALSDQTQQSQRTALETVSLSDRSHTQSQSDTRTRSLSGSQPLTTSHISGNMGAQNQIPDSPRLHMLQNGNLNIPRPLLSHTSTAESVGSHPKSEASNCNTNSARNAGANAGGRTRARAPEMRQRAGSGSTNIDRYGERSQAQGYSY